jgi:hypothetical protein
LEALFLDISPEGGDGAEKSLVFEVEQGAELRVDLETFGSGLEMQRYADVDVRRARPSEGEAVDGFGGGRGRRRPSRRV